MEVPQLEKSRYGLYLVLFCLFCLCGLGLVSYHEIRNITSDGVVATVVAIIKGMEAVVVISAALTYTIIQGADMLAEKYKRRRYEQGRAEGKSEAFDAVLKATPEGERESVNRIIEEARALIDDRDKSG